MLRRGSLRGGSSGDLPFTCRRRAYFNKVPVGVDCISTVSFFSFVRFLGLILVHVVGARMAEMWRAGGDFGCRGIVVTAPIAAVDPHWPQSPPPTVLEVISLTNAVDFTLVFAQPCLHHLLPPRYQRARGKKMVTFAGGSNGRAAAVTDVPTVVGGGTTSA
ncbi:RNA-binding protein 47C [Striga asiatica]|uniref:RNA-binding protein 47C n=1 Tax=Striga asiatica TaxID=4170 RepID=A0A5A7P8T8_STRAF|nr:RNA-binding protein 47C [Striga asiatica]